MYMQWQCFNRCQLKLLGLAPHLRLLCSYSQFCWSVDVSASTFIVPLCTRCIEGCSPLFLLSLRWGYLNDWVWLFSKQRNLCGILIIPISLIFRRNMQSWIVSYSLLVFWSVWTAALFFPFLVGISVEDIGEWVVLFLFFF